MEQSMPTSDLSLSSTCQLSDGRSMPILGLGVYQAFRKGDVERAVLVGIRNGFKRIETSAIYQNEEEVGAALKKSGVRREDIYITTKLANEDQGRESTFKAFHRSLEKLGLEYLDSYLIHTPVGGNVVESWTAMLELQKQGLVKSIGLCNFNIDHLEEFKKAFPTDPPAVNQFAINIHRRHTEVIEFCRKEGIAVEANYPAGKGDKLERTYLVEIGYRFMKSPGQIQTRWVLQHGIPCVVKANKVNDVKEVGDVFDFALTEDDMKQLDDVVKRRDHSGMWDCLRLDWEG